MGESQSDVDASTRRRRSSRLSSTVESGDGEAHEVARRKRHRRRKKRRSSREIDPPFHILVLQVGATLFVLCTVTFWLWQSLFIDESYSGEVLEEYEAIAETYDDDVSKKLEAEADVVPNLEPTQAPTKPTAPPLPVWELGKLTKYDAFGISDIAEQEPEKSGNHQPFWTTAASLKKQFADLYGGENAVRAMMERGLSVFPMGYDGNSPPSDLVHTACRIRLAKEEGRPFKFTFGGYSVTVGRGNYFGQSFPFVMKRILESPFQLLGITLSVKNAAIGGCPSFPYGFCKKNHWGEDSDVVSWDFSMNEPGGITEGLEAYLRHTMTLSHRPKLIVKDTHMADKRREVLKRYVALGAIKDPLVLHSDPAARPFLDRKEDFRPEGFQSWRKFGSPPGAPGQALHHPAVKEHEMVGWMLAMHFLSALELVASNLDDASGRLQFTCPSPAEEKESRLTTNLLPPPMAADVTTMKEWSSLFFGVPQEPTALDQQWKMNPVYCKTSYDPIVDSSGSLTSIVVAGSTGEDMDVMLPKGHMFYNKAWTFDLSDAEKEAKRKLDRFGGLGYVDSKKAYRGLFNSGTLRLLVPYYHDNNGAVGAPKVGDPARDWFQNLVVCEVNERSEPFACQTGKDVTFVTGGVNATEVTLLDTPGTLFLGKKICTHVRIPADAKITSKEAMLLEDPLLPSAEKKQFQQAIEANKISIGLSLDMSVHDHLIVARENACSISHVVWEQRIPGGVRLPLSAKTTARANKDAGKQQAPPTDSTDELPWLMEPPFPVEKDGSQKPVRSAKVSPQEAQTLEDPAILVKKEDSKQDVKHKDPVTTMKANPADSAPHDKLRGVPANPKVDPTKPAKHVKLRGVHGHQANQQEKNMKVDGQINNVLKPSNGHKLSSYL